MSISNVDFGALDAEQDQHLMAYFVNVGIENRILLSRKRYIIGRKGSGKTALFKRLQNKIPHSVVPLYYDDYPWETHKKIKENGVPLEAAYVASWKFLLLVTMISYWSEQENFKQRKRAKKIIKEMYAGEKLSLGNILFDKFKRIRKLSLPSIGEDGASLGGFELDKEQNAGPFFAAIISSFAKKLIEFVMENYADYPITILLDKLDDGWDASDESKALLSGILKATRDICMHLPTEKTSPVIVFLRTDIYDNLRFNDKNKISSEIEYLDWSEDSLIDVANARISNSLKCEQDKAWATVFSDGRMRQRATIRSYIIKRTMSRPRDIVSFCIFCREAAIANKHSIVSTQDVYEAEEQYSRHIFDELDDEMHKQFSNAKEILQVVRNIQNQRFTLDTWTQAYLEAYPNATKAQALADLRSLFDYSIVGVPKVGGKAGGTVYQFAYQDRLLQPNFAKDMIVHFSLKKVLSLRDKGA